MPPPADKPSKKKSAASLPSGDGNAPKCACGCGHPTKRYAQTSTKRGFIKGQYGRFLHGHNRDQRPKAFAPDRFWAMVDVRDDDDCWPWTGASRGFGHGVFWLDGRNVVSSRYVYELTYGELPPSVYVLHRCDNPPCCNPRHLFTGSQADNMRDMVEKGRSLKHEAHNRAKLTEDQVAEIRERRASGESLGSIAADFGVTAANISYIARGLTWR